MGMSLIIHTLLDSLVYGNEYTMSPLGIALSALVCMIADIEVLTADIL